MIYVIKHPLIETKMSKLRNRDTGTKEFREICSEIATLLCYEATKDLPTIPITVDTPIEITTCNTLERCIVFVPILRAGMGILDGMLNLIPTAKVGHIGLYRDPDTLNPIEYYCKLPSHSEHCDVFVLDPMLATGGTASAAINELKKRNISNIKLIVLVACPTGIQRIENDHPDVVIYAASNDSHLNEHGYIVPGLGDAGDRIFGTK